MTMTQKDNFGELKLDKRIVAAVKEMGFEEPSPIQQQAIPIGRNKRIKAVPVYGGQPIERQIRALKSGVQIVIGTPGRLLDHIRRGTIKLNHVRYLVLDEADEMLDMGFIDDMEDIMANVPAERQTMLFSATMPRPILSLTKKYMRAPQIVTVSKEEIT